MGLQARVDDDGDIEVLDDERNVTILFTLLQIRTSLFARTPPRSVIGLGGIDGESESTSMLDVWNFACDYARRRGLV